MRPVRLRYFNPVDSTRLLLNMCPLNRVPGVGSYLLRLTAHALVFSAAWGTASAWGADADEGGLTEIVVTAQRFNSTVQNTPISLSAISGEQLDAAGVTSVEELAREIPGLSMRSAGPGQTEYEARGLSSSGGSAPTVGFYLNEVPMTPPAQSQTGKVVIDPNLYDVDRIEVLRGPQGTLYGSGSMGGTVRVITNEPKLNTLEGSVQGTLSDTQGGSGNGGGSFMLNVPFGDVLAARVVGTDTYRSGWIDRVVLNPFPQDGAVTRGNVMAAPVQSVTTDVNTEHLYGGRLSVLFKPNDDLSVDAFTLYQHMEMGGYDEFDNPPGAGYPAHYEAAPVAEPIGDTLYVYGLTVTDNLGFADLTSATGYFRRREDQTQDASESFSNVLGIYPYIAVPFSEVDITRQFSQEIRLSSQQNERLNWVGGLFYSDDRSDWDLYSAQPAFSSPPDPNGILVASDFFYRVRQYAAFADGSYQFADNWKFETGLRWYRYQSDAVDEQYGALLASPIPTAPQKFGTSDNGFNPRFDLSYTPSNRLTEYLSIAKGYRPGGPSNGQLPDICGGGQSPSYKPDTVWDYELGEKARLFDNWLTINSDVYYIEWKGAQEVVTIPACGYTYNANAGNGRSFGPELEITAKLSANWTVAANANYTNAKIDHPTTAFATAILATAPPGGLSGCHSVSDCTVPILNVPEYGGSLALSYATKVFNGYDLTARVSGVYVGPSTDQAFYFGVPLPSYYIANARAGLAGEKWSVSVFVDNLNNKVAWNTANNTQFQFNIPQLTRISTNQPRTFGTEINYRF
jgi:outer membrane receptor protein involved in Fe transport